MLKNVIISIISYFHNQSIINNDTKVIDESQNNLQKINVRVTFIFLNYQIY